MVKGFSNGTRNEARHAAGHQQRISAYHAKSAARDARPPMDPQTTLMYMAAQIEGRNHQKTVSTYRTQLRIAHEADRNYERAVRYSKELSKVTTPDEAGRVMGKIERLKESNENLKHRFRRTFASDDNAKLTSMQAGGVEGAIIGGTILGVAGLLIGGYALAPMFYPTPTPQPSKPQKLETKVVQSIPDSKFHIDDGNLYLNDSHVPMENSYILKHLNETILFTEEQMAKIPDYLKEIYKNEKIDLKFNPDASMDVIITDTSIGIQGTDNHIDAEDVHAKVLTNLSGTFYNESMKYALLPIDPYNIPDNVSGAVWKIDDSMKGSIKGITGKYVDFNAINFSYNGSGNLTASFGIVDKDRNFTFVDNVPQDRIKNCLYKLADNDTDEDVPVKEMLETFKDNALMQENLRIKGEFDLIKGKRDQIQVELDAYHNVRTDVFGGNASAGGINDTLNGLDEQIRDVYERLNLSTTPENRTELNNTLTGLLEDREKLLKLEELFKPNYLMSRDVKVLQELFDAGRQIGIVKDFDMVNDEPKIRKLMGNDTYDSWKENKYDKVTVLDSPINDELNGGIAAASVDGEPGYESRRTVSQDGIDSVW